jgi:hypothetical protein
MRGMMARFMLGGGHFCRALWRCDNRRGKSVEFEDSLWKRSVDAVLVEIGANRQSCDPSMRLLLKLVLEVVADAAGNVCGREPVVS